MATITNRATLSVSIHFEVDEQEARALHALAGYGDDAFIKHFYEKLGTHYMRPHEKGLRRFLQSIRSVVGPELHKLDEARKVFEEGRK